MTAVVEKIQICRNAYGVVTFISICKKILYLFEIEIKTKNQENVSILLKIKICIH